MGSGIQKKIKRSVLERVDAIEASVQNLVEQINQSLSAVEKQLTMHQELVGALVSIVGVEPVKEAIETARAAKKQQELEAMIASAQAAKAALEAGLTNGEIAAAEICGERSVIVGVERDKEGVEIPPGRSQLLFAMVKPEFQEKLLGKPVGTVIETATGGTFTVDGLFDFTGKSATEPAEDATGEPTAEAEAVETAVLDELVADSKAN